MSQVSWKILPWHRRLNKLKSRRPGYKSELGVFSNASTVLQLKDVKHGFGTGSLLPSDIDMFVFHLEYVHWSHKNVTPDEKNPPRTLLPVQPQLHAGSGVVSPAPANVMSALSPRSV